MPTCEMVAGFSTDEHGDNTGEILCGNPAVRDGCCEACFEAMLKSDEFAPGEVEAMYPVLSATQEATQ